MEKTEVNLTQKKLALFFTYRVSLSLWKKKGLLQRELFLYKNLAKKFSKIYFITYGKEDAVFAEELKQYNIFVLPKKSALPNFLYSLCIPFLYRKELKECDFYKTNQMLGSWTAVLSKYLYKKKLIVRSGYPLSLNAKREGYWKYLFSRVIEYLALGSADQFAVATEYEKEYFSSSSKKIPIEVIPNYVDTQLFKAKAKTKTESINCNVLFVGRLSPEKNIANLIGAIQDLPHVSLTLIGEGDLRSELQELAKPLGNRVEFLGKVEYRDLPSYFQRADIFVLPSLYEGNPKVLLEAMSSALPIVGTRVQGIENIIRDGQTGLLVGTSSLEIQAGIEKLTKDIALCQSLASQARMEIENNFSFERILEKELNQYN